MHRPRTADVPDRSEAPHQPPWRARKACPTAVRNKVRVFCSLALKRRIDRVFCRAIENGANSLAEGFLFAVAAGLILGEQYRSSRNQSKRRDTVDDQLDELKSSVEGLNARLDVLARQQEERMTEESMRYVLHLSYVPIYACASLSEIADIWSFRHDELARILQRVVEIGLRGGWAEFEGTPLPLPHIDITHRPPPSPSSESSSGSQDTPSANPSSSQ